MSVPPDGVLCAMKVAAMLDRQKGRDFYDVMFLLSQSAPDYDFLFRKVGISILEELKAAAEKAIMGVDLKNKMRDFEHLLFNKTSSIRNTGRCWDGDRYSVRDKPMNEVKCEKRKVQGEKRKLQSAKVGEEQWPPPI
jgi:hypothetical protein